MKIRLLITDDHELVRAGLMQFLGAAPDIEVVAEAADGNEGINVSHPLADGVARKGGDAVSDAAHGLLTH